MKGCTWWILMFRRFRICRAKGGRSWPSSRVLSECKCGVANQSHSSNFGPISLKRIEHGLRYEDSMFYLFQSDRSKICGVTLICNTSWFFATRPIFSYDLTLSGNNFETEARLPKRIIFSESWVGKKSVGRSPEKIFCWKFSGRERLPKHSLFREFPCTHIKKCSGPVFAQLWCHLPHSYFEP